MTTVLKKVKPSRCSMATQPSFLGPDVVLLLGEGPPVAVVSVGALVCPGVLVGDGVLVV